MVHRRFFLAGGTSLLSLIGMGAWPGGTFAQQDAIQPYDIDFAEVERAFPPAFGPPPLLRQMVDWLADKPWRSIGMFDISPQWADLHFAGAEHYYAEFALFIHLADGSSVGYWLNSGNSGRPPIVLLGSEGENLTLTPDLETLIARIALGNFGEKGPEADFLHYDGEFEGDVVPDLRADLGRFLTGATGIDDLPGLVAKAGPAHVDLAAWVSQSEKNYRAALEANTDMQAIAGLLAPYKPDGDSGLESGIVRITWVGDDYDAWQVDGAAKDLAEADRLRPHLAALRMHAAVRTAGLGLWHSATLLVRTDAIEFIPDYIGEPRFRSTRPSADAFRADQHLIPREARRIPAWLRPMLT